MEFVSYYGGDDGEYNDVGLVEISRMFVSTIFSLKKNYLTTYNQHLKHYIWYTPLSSSECHMSVHIFMVDEVVDRGKRRPAT